MFFEDKVTEFFYMVDEFFYVFTRMMAKFSINGVSKLQKRKYNFRQLINEIYEEATKMVPAAKLADFVAQGKRKKTPHAEAVYHDKRLA